MQVLSFSLLLAKSGLSFVEIRWLQLDRKGHNSVASRLSCILRALPCCLRRASLASRCSAVSWLRACALLPLSISLCQRSLASHCSAVSQSPFSVAFSPACKPSFAIFRCFRSSSLTISLVSSSPSLCGISRVSSLFILSSCGIHAAGEVGMVIVRMRSRNGTNGRHNFI